MSDTASAPDPERRSGNSEILHRLDDVTTTVRGLATRVKILEEGAHATHEELTRYNGELRANTMLTKQSHEAIFGTTEAAGIKAVVDGVNDLMRGDGNGDPGLISKVEDVHQMLDPARSFFRGLGKVGRAGVSVSDLIEKRPKTLLSLVVGCVAAYSLSTTGKLPEWAGWLVKLLSA